MSARDDIFDIGEVIPDFLLESSHGVRVADQVEDSGCEAGRRCVCASDHEDVTLAPEFGSVETFSRFGVLGVEEVVEEIFLGVVAGTRAFFGALVGFDTALLNKVPAVVGEFSNEDFVQVPAIQVYPEAALREWVSYFISVLGGILKNLQRSGEMLLGLQVQ